MTGTRSSRPRRAVVVAGSAVLVLLVAGTVLARIGSGDGDADREAAVGAVGPDSGPAAGDVASGGARSEQGAVAAAVTYASLGQRWLYLTDGELRREVTEVATPASAERLADGVVADIQAARDELADAEGRVWWLVRPLAWRLDDFTGDTAVVQVWTVSVLAAAGVALPQSEWTTVTLDLEWADRAWQIDAIREEPGPTPMTSPADEPWDAHPFDAALDGFTRVTSDQPSDDVGDAGGGGP